MTALLVILAVLAPVATAAAAWVLRGRREAAVQRPAVAALVRQVEAIAKAPPSPALAKRLEEVRTQTALDRPPLTLKQLRAELEQPDEW